MNTLVKLAFPAILPVFLLALAIPAESQIPAFPLTEKGLVISRPTQPQQPFTVAGPRGVLVGTQDGQFESWILPVKLLSHLTIEANVEGYSVPIEVNPQSANIEVRPDHTTLTYSHIAFTLRQIMFSPDRHGECSPGLKVSQGFSLGMKPSEGAGGFNPRNSSVQEKGALAQEPCSTPSTGPFTGPIVLFQIDSNHPLDLTFRFTPEMRWMWPKRNDGIPGAEWVAAPSGGYYTLHMDYPDLAGAITIPTATPGILAPYQERPQVHPLELHLHYDPKRDGNKYFPLLMAVGTTKATATNAALGESLARLNAGIPEAYKSHAAYYEKLLADATSIETPDKALNEAFQWGIVSIEQLKAHEYASNQDALVAGYFASGDSARPGFGWFFGRDSLYTLYAVNSFGDFALTRAELEFLIARQREDGKIMHEFAQTAADPSVDWKQFPYMYAAADATPLFLMAMRDYLRTSGDIAFVQKHHEAVEKAWAFETAPTSDTDHDGIYDNSQGTGWVESWPHDKMPHQEVYLALLDKQASLAYSALEDALSHQRINPAGSQRDQATESVEHQRRAEHAEDRADAIKAIIEQEYYDKEKGCYAFSHNAEGDPNGATDKSSTIYPAIAWWDYSGINAPAIPSGSDWRVRRAVEASERPSANAKGEGLVKGHDFSRANKRDKQEGVLTPEGIPESPLAHPAACLQQWASPTLATDWGLRDVATTEPFYDGMSYHQGSVWPLFTGWGALAEYRANQPLPAEQMLMQNVDLTWAQDPGAVTELLSGDFFVPFGRSTSHQLWSSAMVLTPTLRGLFGINIDAATNTITVNPHLPANWNRAEIKKLHLGQSTVDLIFRRDRDILTVFGEVKGPKSNTEPVLKLRSDQPSRISKYSRPDSPSLEWQLPAVAIIPTPHTLPSPGNRPEQIKILSVEYGQLSLTAKVSAPAGTDAIFDLQRNLPTAYPLLKSATSPGDSEKQSTRGRVKDLAGREDPRNVGPFQLELYFPESPGYQTLEFTLTW